MAQLSGFAPDHVAIARLVCEKSELIYPHLSTSDQQSAMNKAS